MRQEILQDVADKQTPTKHFIEMYKLLSGWWLTYPLKNMKVSWDDSSQYMEK